MTKEELHNSIHIVATSMDPKEIQKHRAIINTFLTEKSLHDSDLVQDWNKLVDTRVGEAARNLDSPNISAKLNHISSIIDILGLL
ncbi:MAG: hypothetical protein DI539_11700 [Flavobacterium psychrophilum]|nr:MAG: hypothetical protein DI539_11700 [Flavobacterium psychrophilum]